MYLSPDTKGIDAPKWLQVIHAVNEVRPGTFGEPTSTGESATGRYVEEYPEARVTFPPEALRFTPHAGVIVEGKTALVTALIVDTAKRLGFTETAAKHVHIPSYWSTCSVCGKAGVYNAS